MSDEIRVSIFKRSDQVNFTMQYRDLITGNKVRRSAGTHKQRDAERKAAIWEKEIRSGIDHRNGRMSWALFREKFEDQHLESLAAKSRQKYISVLNVYESLMHPQRLRDLSEQALSLYQAKLRKLGRSEMTIKGHLTHVCSALSWAKQKRYLDVIPTKPKVQRAKNSKLMKGRAITTEEFERMLAAVKKVIVEPNKGKAKARKDRKPDLKRIPSWQDFLVGLWLSGLRLGEAVELHWTDEEKIRPDGELFRVPKEAEKGNEDRLLPMAPEFSDWLDKIPKRQRNGYVFNPLPQNPGRGRLGIQTIGRTICEIGMTAGVVVDRRNKQAVFASSHDLRRCFGERWAARIMPPQLMELMRHEDIQTTMRFYVGQNARKTVCILRESVRHSPIDVGAILGAIGSR